MRIALFLALIAGPAAAQQICPVGQVGWTGDARGYAHYGPCESPGEGLLTFTCQHGRASITIADHWNASEGQRVSATLVIDGRAYPIMGTAYENAMNMTMSLTDGFLGGDILEALADGHRFAILSPSGRTPGTLRGSRAAIETMKRGCQ